MILCKDKNRCSRAAFGIIAGIVVSFLIKQLFFATPSNDKILIQVANKLNEQCPVMIDRETRLDNVIALPDNTFAYNYTLVNMVKDSIDLKVFEDYMHPMILNNVRTHPDLKFFRDNKVTMVYNYRDKNGVFITKISIPPKEYQTNQNNGDKKKIY